MNKKIILVILFLLNLTIYSSQGIYLSVDLKKNYKTKSKEYSFKHSKKLKSQFMTIDILVKNMTTNTKNLTIEWYFFGKKINNKEKYIANYGSEEFQILPRKNKLFTKNSNTATIRKTSDYKEFKRPSPRAGGGTDTFVFRQRKVSGTKIRGYLVFVKDLNNKILDKKFYPNYLQKYANKPKLINSLLNNQKNK